MSKDDVPFRFALGNVWGDLEKEQSQSFDDLGQSDSAGDTSLFRPTMNMVETQDELVVTFDLPGVALKDIAIEIKSGELSVSGSRPGHAETTEGKWHHMKAAVVSLSAPCDWVPVSIPTGLTLNSKTVFCESAFPNWNRGSRGRSISVRS